MKDNVARSFRTALQVILGVIGAGGLIKAWEAFGGTHSINPTIQVFIVLVCATVITWLQGTLEDAFGRGILIPQDQIVGDVVLNEGAGAKRLSKGKLGELDMKLRTIQQPSPTYRGDKARY